MNTILKTHIIKIGNSQGIRIPKIWLENLGPGSEVEMVVEPNQIIIRSAHHPRHNWNEQFRAMAAQGDDHLLDEVTATDWDNEEWTW